VFRKTEENMEEKTTIGDLEQQIIELQTLSAYQEATIAALDQVLQKQQDQIDRLELALSQLRERVESPPESQEGFDLEAERPPHY
jgi:SlyX protein